MSQWCYKMHDREVGPVTFQELSALTRSGEITEAVRVRRVGSQRWEPAWMVVGLFRDSVATTDNIEKADHQAAACGPSAADAAPAVRVRSRFEDWLNWRGALSSVVGAAFALAVYRASYWQAVAFPVPTRGRNESLYYFPIIGLCNAWECEILYLDIFVTGAVLGWFAIEPLRQRLVAR